MQLKIIGTGSAGNCYLLENEHEALLIECGVRFEKIKQAIDFEIDKIVGCIVTHEHGDHVGVKASGLLNVLKHGIECFSGEGTFKVLNVKHHNAIFIKSGKQFIVGGFKILPFDAVHANSDGSPCAEPFSFIIHHEDCGDVLFITDSQYCKYNFNGVFQFNNIIIEANFCDEIIKKKRDDGKIQNFLYERIIESHMSIETCKNTLLANDLSHVNNIVLIHLSDSNSHENNFKKTIIEATGRSVHVANNNQVLEFNKTRF